MLVSFSVENFLSFKEMQTFDMTAIGTCKERLEENIFKVSSKKLLKSAVIYGANASGKSNFFHAFAFFRNFILSSSKDSMSSDEIKVLPFLLNTENLNKPSKFEIEFFLGTKKYRYGFNVNTKQVLQEWLYKNSKLIFTRAFDGEDDIIQVENIWKKARGLEERTRKNALFLSVCAQFALPNAEEIVTWLVSKLNIVFGAHAGFYRNYTNKKLYSEEYQNDILTFIRNADMGVRNIFLEESSKNNEQNDFSPQKEDEIKIFSLHNVYDNAGAVIEKIRFPFYGLESLGTQKAYDLSGPIVNALKEGSTLLIDELDSRLHPIFTRQIVKLFNSSKTNPYNAQLIFNTHDTNLLSYKVYNENTGHDEYMFRRDQIYFAEKDNVEATHIYSLIEFKKENNQKIRNDASFEKDYLNGIYGAIPFIGDLLKLSDDKED